MSHLAGRPLAIAFVSFLLCALLLSYLPLKVRGFVHGFRIAVLLLLTIESPVRFFVPTGIS
jgi:hypothetical protein